MWLFVLGNVPDFLKVLFYYFTNIYANNYDGKNCFVYLVFTVVLFLLHHAKSNNFFVTLNLIHGNCIKLRKAF